MVNIGPWSPGPRFFTYTHIVAGWYSHCLLISPFWLMHITILDIQPLNFVGKKCILAVKVPHFWWEGPFIRACWHYMSDLRSLCRAYRALASSWVGWQMARWHVRMWRVFAGYVWISKIEYTQGSMSDYEIFWVWTCWYFEYLNDHGNYWPTQHLWLWDLDTKRPRGVLTLIHRRTKCRSEKGNNYIPPVDAGRNFLHYIWNSRSVII